MAPSKPLRTYGNRSFNQNNISKSVDVFNALFAKNLMKRGTIQRKRKKKIIIKELSPHKVTDLTDCSLQVNTDDTFDKLVKGDVYNKILCKNEVLENVSAQTEHTQPNNILTNISINITSPVCKRTRKRTRQIADTSSPIQSLNKSKECNSTLDKSISVSLVIEKEHKGKVDYSTLSYIKIPDMGETLNCEKTNLQISIKSYNAKHTSVLPINSLMSQPFCSTPIPSKKSDEQLGETEQIKKSYDDIMKWNYTLPSIISEQIENQNVSCEVVMGDGNFEVSGQTKQALDDKKLNMCPKVILHNHLPNDATQVKERHFKNNYGSSCSTLFKDKRLTMTPKVILSRCNSLKNVSDLKGFSGKILLLKSQIKTDPGLNDVSLTKQMGCCNVVLNRLSSSKIRNRNLNIPSFMPHSTPYKCKSSDRCNSAMSLLSSTPSKNNYSIGDRSYIDLVSCSEDESEVKEVKHVLPCDNSPVYITLRRRKILLKSICSDKSRKYYSKSEKSDFSNISDIYCVSDSHVSSKCYNKPGHSTHNSYLQTSEFGVKSSKLGTTDHDLNISPPFITKRLSNKVCTDLVVKKERSPSNCFINDGEVSAISDIIPVTPEKIRSNGKSQKHSKFPNNNKQTNNSVDLSERLVDIKCELISNDNIKPVNRNMFNAEPYVVLENLKIPNNNKDSSVGSTSSETNKNVSSLKAVNDSQYTISHNITVYSSFNKSKEIVVSQASKTDNAPENIRQPLIKLERLNFNPLENNEDIVKTESDMTSFCDNMCDIQAEDVRNVSGSCIILDNTPTKRFGSLKSNQRVSDKHVLKNQTDLSAIAETSNGDCTAKTETESFLMPKPKMILKPGKSWRRSLAQCKRNSLALQILKDADQSGHIGAAATSCIERKLSRRQSIRIVPVKAVPPIRESTLLETYALSKSGYVSNNDVDAHLEESVRNIRNLSINGEESLIEENPVTLVTAKDIVLRKCGQTEPLVFQECYKRSEILHCQKIGEGVYGEVFLYRNKDGGTTVMKVIPIEGDRIVNGERQKKFEEILSEIIIAMELSNLRNNPKNQAVSFSEVVRIRCVQGCYPEKLIELWELFDETRGSENDTPSIFTEEQLYIILELANGGNDLEAFVFTNAIQAYSVFEQTICALAVAENELEFEHRDLHWGNILITMVDKNKKLDFCLNNEAIQVATKGVQVSIIDFTLSRIMYDGVVIYNDLGLDPDLFTAKGDYQFEIYRQMQKRNGNEWQHFEPYSNILWLHYLLDKMISALRYRNIQTKIHKTYIEKLKDLKNEILNYSSVKDLVYSKFM